MVALHTVSIDTATVDSSIPDADLVIALEPTASLDADGAATLVEAAAAQPSTAWFGDVTVSGTPQLRPGWSPTRLVVDPTAASPLAVQAGWLRAHSCAPGDPELALRLVRDGATVTHLSATLSHHATPIPAPSASAIQRHLDDVGVDARVESQRFVPDKDVAPRVTIVIPTAGASLGDGTVAVRRLLDRLADRPDRIDVVLVIGDEFVGDASDLAAPGVTVVPRPTGRFNFATAVNLGVLHATAPLVLLLNDDTEPADHHFVDQMALHFSDRTVGGVGALLTYPDGTVQHAGIVLDDARPLHPFVGWEPDAIRVHGGHLARDVVAVTAGCLLVRRDDYLAVGGLSPSFPLSFNDVDLCVRLRRAGRRIVIDPAATLIHHETLTREPTIDAEEWDRWIHRWGQIDDPWYHPAHHRPDDPRLLSRNADHLPPKGPPPAPVARAPWLRSVVHRGRPAPVDR